MTAAEKNFGQYSALMADFNGQRRVAPLLEKLSQEAAAVLPAAMASYRPDPMGVDAARPDKLFAPDYGVNLMRLGMPVDAASAFKCGVPNLNSLLCVVANDTFHSTTQLERNRMEGLTICSLNNVPAALQSKVYEVLTRSLKNSDPVSALNSLLLNDGVLIHVAAGVKVEKAIQIVNLSNPTVPLLSARRIVVMAEEGSDVKILLCDHSQTDTVEHLNVQLVDVDVAAHAHVELYDIEEATSTTRRCWQLHARQASNSHLSVNTTYLHGGITRNEYHVDVPGDYAHTELSGLAICGGEQVVDNQVTLTHTGKHCTSHQVCKNALFDCSRGGFGGKIVVGEGAVFTDASQTNRNLLAGDDARMTAAPQLEIYCDEVKCSHGATTGQLDERALFYMQTRGIPSEEARRMLTQAFMVDVIDNISFEVLRQRIHMLVEKRLAGAGASCGSCAAGCHTDESAQ